MLRRRNRNNQNVPPHSMRLRNTAQRVQRQQAEQNRLNQIELSTRRSDTNRGYRVNVLNNSSPNQIQQQRKANREAQRLHRANETARQTARRRQNDLLAHRESRRLENANQSQLRRAQVADSMRESRSRSRSRDITNRNDDENQMDFVDIEAHYCGEMNVICQFCSSKNFEYERSSNGFFKSCCHFGKVKLESIVDVNGNQVEYPQFLREMLLNPDNENYKNFRDCIRSYNSSLSFASMGAKVSPPPGYGPYVFRVQGQIYHLTSTLHPSENETPKYAQLYALDSSTQATNERMQLPENQNLNRNIIYQIDQFVRANNRLSQTYQMMKDVESEETERARQNGQQVPIVTMMLKRNPRAERRFNAPTANEIAMVFVNDGDGEPPFQRDIRVYPTNLGDPNKRFENISILSPYLDPLTYVLLYPYGNFGWQPGWECDSYENSTRNRVRTKVSMLQFKSAQTAIRGDFNPIINAGKLSQQWIVDSYLQVEANNLNFIRQNQKKLRADLYQGLADFMANEAANLGVPAGKPVILPSSFEGSPRNMRERCNDAMAIFSKVGSVDLFVTMTANPNWREILENLKRGETPSDRPDLVSRVFAIKLEALLHDITKNNLLGKCVGSVDTIEFQKRGLPHAHILLTVQQADKFTNAASIDRVVCAEIPDKNTDPILFEIVTRCMIHGPCGSSNPNSPCMVDGKCKKNFPKDFQMQTVANSQGYPLYKRRPGVSIKVRNSDVDNRFVVPYNRHLLLKYQCHINVEVCTSVKAIIYIYKYIYKGFDCAEISIQAGERRLMYDEIKMYQESRYVSASEAMWRLLENKMHDRSHSVLRLPVHLPNEQQIRFEEGNEEEALNDIRNRVTKLTAWFTLNNEDQEANQYFYSDIPLYYRYVNSKWQKRLRSGQNVIARIYTVNPAHQERFCLRILLHHVKGAKSFEDIRTFDGICHPTFVEAARQRGIFQDDEEWEKCIREAISMHKPYQLRQFFAVICVFCSPPNARDLWDKYKEHMSLDYLRNHDEETSYNFSLHDISFVLKQHSLQCSSFNLPEPSGQPIELTTFNSDEEKREAERLIPTLNTQQRSIFDEIIHSVYDDNSQNRCFYLDGPGGSGKTYLYRVLMSYIRGNRDIVFPLATTGIAATLMKGGRTVHSGFKLPVPLIENSTSNLKPSSVNAKDILESKLIIIDEVTMLPKHGLRCIDLFLRDAFKYDPSKRDKPFANKVILIGGDFRQCLPVVPRASPIEIIETCIKSSYLWINFKKLSLIKNMRSEGQNEFNNWLLKIGSGSFKRIENLADDLVEIPNDMIVPEEADIVSLIFGTDLQSLSSEDLSKRVILYSTNIDALNLNNEITDRMYGMKYIYNSNDSIITDGQNDQIAKDITVEFLNNLTLSGMPPHTLNIKVGMIVMLIRNLNPKKGLCNGTRLIVISCHRHLICAKIINESHQNEIVTIPRIDLKPSDSNLPFTLKRRQFPVIPAFAMTINKSQGQTFDHVGIILNEPVFSHGQLYVALSRSRNKNNIKIQIKKTAEQGAILENDSRVFTKNVIYHEVLQ